MTLAYYFMMSTPGVREAPERLDSWKEIAAYLGRGVRTVHRWEEEEGLPVHRHSHSKAASVYAFRSELDAWLSQRSAEHANDLPVQECKPAFSRRRNWTAWAAVGIALLLLLFILLFGHFHFQIRL